MKTGNISISRKWNKENGKRYGAVDGLVRLSVYFGSINLNKFKIDRDCACKSQNCLKSKS